MRTRPEKKSTYYIIVAVIVVSFIYLYFSGKAEQKKKATIEATGIETIGTVINRTVGRNGKHQATNYGIKFDFEHNGKRVQSYALFHTRWRYERAIIGMKYRVKYLPDAPRKNAIIYIEEPIFSEYANIEKERERVFSTYNTKKNARSLDEIQHLIPR